MINEKFNQETQAPRQQWVPMPQIKHGVKQSSSKPVEINAAPATPQAA